MLSMSICAYPPENIIQKIARKIPPTATAFSVGSLEMGLAAFQHQKMIYDHPIISLWALLMFGIATGETTMVLHRGIVRRNFNQALIETLPLSVFCLMLFVSFYVLE